MEGASAVFGGKATNWFRRWVWLPSKLVFAPFALVFIAYVVWLSRGDILRILRAADGVSLAFACVCLGATHFFSPLASRTILQLLGTTMEYRLLLRIHLCRLPARYLPGGVWHTVGRALDLHDCGAPKAAIAWMVAIENALAICLAFLVGGVLLLLAGVPANSYVETIWLGVAFAFATLVALPAFLLKFWPDPMRTMGTVIWTRCCGWFVVIWILHAAAFVAYSIALFGTSTLLHALQTGGVYLFSWATGLVAFFAPQGIGVFEVTATALSGQGFSPANLALVAGFRLCMLSVDLCLGLGCRFRRRE